MKGLLHPFRVMKELIHRIPAFFVIKKIPLDSVIRYPFQIRGGKNIYVGHGVTINKYSWFDALPVTGCDSVELRFGDNVRMNFNNHIIASHRIVIGNNVNMGNAVYIADNSHEYEDITIAPRYQPVKQLHDVIIGDDTWIGERAIILGARIGKHCVIGSQSIVNRDIPDYCVVVGAPAKIIKRYDFDLKQWRKTDPQGNFMD